MKSRWWSSWRQAHPAPSPRAITERAWAPVPQPTLSSRRPDAQSWELTRYRAYQAHVAGHTIGEIFDRAVAFLQLAAATSIGGLGAGNPS